MHIISRSITAAQHTRLQFRSHTTAGRTDQGIQNRSLHLTRGWAKIRFRGHSTGWWHFLECFTSCSKSFCSNVVIRGPWINKSRGDFFFRWFEVFGARWPFRRCTRHKTWNEVERLQCMNAQEPFNALESFSPLWKCEKVWRRIWTLNRFFNLPLSSFHVNLKIYYLCRQRTASFCRRKRFWILFSSELEDSPTDRVVNCARLELFDDNFNDRGETWCITSRIHLFGHDLHHLQANRFPINLGTGSICALAKNSRPKMSEKPSCTTTFSEAKLVFFCRGRFH